VDTQSPERSAEFSEGSRPGRFHLDWLNPVPHNRAERFRQQENSMQRTGFKYAFPRWARLLCAWCVALLLCGQARSQPGEREESSVLIRNVTILKLKAGEEPIHASLILRGGRLDIVTLDIVEADAVDLEYDACGGFLLGKLEPGVAPSFIVLSEDPRGDFAVLLDTDKYTTLAVKDGVIVRNHLLPSSQEQNLADGEQAPKRSGWLAYTPPPISLPLNYDLSQKWNAWETGWTNGAFLGALVIDRMNWRKQDANSKTQVGELDAFDGGQIRALCFGTVGTLNFDAPWIYTVFLTTHSFDKGFDTRDDDQLTVYDLRLDIPAFAGTTLSVGKQKEPISAERLAGGPYLPMQERSVALDALLPARNTGVALSGNALDADMSWGVGLFNNWIESDGSLSDNATQIAARVAGVPVSSKDESNLIHLGFGLRHSNTKKSVAYATSPEFDQAPAFIDTGSFEANSSQTYDLEAAWLRGPFWLFGEYLLADIDAPGSGNPTIRGHSLTAAWNLTGEMRTYNRRSGVFNPIRVADTAGLGGLGAWEASARWSSLDANTGGLNGGDLDVYSLGLNWWFDRSVVTSVNYRWMTLDRQGDEGHSHGVMMRVVLLLD
jgi:phosphate-selective porin OprO/OprP